MTQEKEFPSHEYLRVGLPDIRYWMDKLFLKPGKLYVPKFEDRTLRLYSQVTIELCQPQPKSTKHGIPVGSVKFYVEDIVNKPVRWGHGVNTVLCLESVCIAEGEGITQSSGIGNVVKVVDGDGVVGWAYFTSYSYLSRFQEIQT